MTDTLRDLYHQLQQVNYDGLLDSHSSPRFVHLHPDDFARLKATATVTRTPTYAHVNALLGLDVLTNTGQPTGSHRITDDHGCLISDSRSGRRATGRP